ncbi:hypothetical protein HRbin29_02127 [bacterium HR29]|nr:hypothetical protein HRbin29_02127 [bacterium HR29]
MSGGGRAEGRGERAGERYPYLERLQPKMDERLERKVPPAGRFCGFCFGRLQPHDTRCPYCEREVAEVGTAREVPQEVLRIYWTKRRVEARWVHAGAMLGLAIASLLFVVLVVWGPGLLGHPGVAFAVLIGGGYLLAQLFGPIIGGQIGYRRAVRRRDALWAAYLARREAESEGRG